MTKYVIANDDDGDTNDKMVLGKWKDLLSDSDSDTNDSKSNDHNNEIDNTSNALICLISHDLLDHNAITTPCNHSFNFIPLYSELLQQKYKGSNLECPYCRTIHINTVLPHVKIHKGMVYKNGINQPIEYCLPFHICEYIFCSGKHKGNQCGSTAYITSNGKYCASHQKTVIIQKEKELVKKENNILKQEQKETEQKLKDDDKKQKGIIKEEKKLLKLKEKEEKKLLKLKEKEESI